MSRPRVMRMDRDVEPRLGRLDVDPALAERAERRGTEATAARTLGTIPDGPFVAFRLRACYAETWLAADPGIPGPATALGTLRTFDEVADLVVR